MMVVVARNEHAFAQPPDCWIASYLHGLHYISENSQTAVYLLLFIKSVCI